MRHAKRDVIPCDAGCGGESTRHFPLEGVEAGRYLCDDCAREEEEQEAFNASLFPPLSRERYSVRQFTREVLGVDFKTPSLWHASGWLTIHNKGDLRRSYIASADIVRFLVNPDYWMAWDLDNVIYPPLKDYLAPKRAKQEWYTLAEAATVLEYQPDTLYYHVRHSRAVVATRYARNLYIRRCEVARIQREGIPHAKSGPRPPAEPKGQLSVYLSEKHRELLEGLGGDRGISEGIRKLIGWYQQGVTSDAR